MSNVRFAQAQASLGRSVVRRLSNAYARFAQQAQTVPGIYTARLVEQPLGSFGAQARETTFEYLAADTAEQPASGDDVLVYADAELATLIGQFVARNPERNVERGSTVLPLEEATQ